MKLYNLLIESIIGHPVERIERRIWEAQDSIYEGFYIYIDKIEIRFAIWFVEGFEFADKDLADAASKNTAFNVSQKEAFEDLTEMFGTDKTMRAYDNIQEIVRLHSTGLSGQKIKDLLDTGRITVGSQEDVNRLVQQSGALDSDHVLSVINKQEAWARMDQDAKPLKLIYNENE